MGVSYLSEVSNRNASSRLSTDWLTGSVQTRPQSSEWRTASVQGRNKHSPPPLVLLVSDGVRCVRDLQVDGDGLRVHFAFPALELVLQPEQH